jgi:hypothetical protein
VENVIIRTATVHCNKLHKHYPWRRNVCWQNAKPYSFTFYVYGAFNCYGQTYYYGGHLLKYDASSDSKVFFVIYRVFDLSKNWRM